MFSIDLEMHCISGRAPESYLASHAATVLATNLLLLSDKDTAIILAWNTHLQRAVSVHLSPFPSQEPLMFLWAAFFCCQLKSASVRNTAFYYVINPPRALGKISLFNFQEVLTLFNFQEPFFLIYEENDIKVRICVSGFFKNICITLIFTLLLVPKLLNFY